MRRVVPWLALAVVASLLLLVLRSLLRDPAAESAARPLQERSAAAVPDATELRGAAPEAVRAEAAAARAVAAPALGGTDDVRAAGSEAGAHLSVAVVRAEGEGPLPGCKVVVWALEDPDDFAVAENEGDVYATDARGRVEAEVPAGRWLLVSAGGPRPSLHGAMPRVPEDEPHAEHEKVAPLASGEAHALRFALTIGRDATFHGRLVAADGGAPIAGARIAATEGAGSDNPPELLRPTTSDASGLFALPCSSWRDPVVWRIDADGYGPAQLLPRLGSETPEDALMIALQRAASLRVSVRGAERRLLTVRASATSYHVTVPAGSWFGSDLEFRAELDASGACTLAGLPPRARLEVTLQDGNEVVRRAAGKFVLEPGEVRPIDWDLRAQATILGRLFDQHGAAIPDAEVWLASEVSFGGETSGSAWFDSYDEQNVVQRARTSPEGAFTFADVPSGTWWLGPAPRPSEWERDERPETDVAPLARSVAIDAGVRERRVDLQVARGLFLRGTVLRPDGTPAPRVFVTVFIAVPPHSGGSASAEADGTFVLGPLLDVEHEVVAFGHKELAASDRVLARPGREDVVLRLKPAGSLEGVVVEAATGERSEAEVWCHERNHEMPFAMEGSADVLGRFTFEGLAPGTYDLIATRYDGLFGSMQRVTVTEGAVREGLRIELAPGARLDVRCSDPSGVAWFEVFAGESRVHLEGTESGTSTTCMVPAGELRVKATMGQSTQERTVSADVGERVELAFEFP